jgi:hypothetical protein
MTAPGQLMLLLGTDTLTLICDVCRTPVHGRIGAAAGYVCCRDGSWFVLHGGCDDNGTHEGYWIPVTRVGTAADLLALSAFLHRQAWFASTDWDTFVYGILRDSGWERRRAGHE